MIKAIFLMTLAIVGLSLMGVNFIELFALDKTPVHLMLFTGATIAIVWGILAEG
jgi:uncharacterized membrane protein